MPVSELQELAKGGGFAAFEARCLELLESGGLSLSQAIAPFEQLARTGNDSEQLANLAKMVLDIADVDAEPKAALAIGRTALLAAPKDEELRSVVIDLYKKAHSGDEGFDVVFESSGIAAGRPTRTAVKLLDMGLTLQPGDTLISRMDDHVVEVTDVDRKNGLFTLRLSQRSITRPVSEVAREYDRIAPDDFRVMQRLRPEQLKEAMHDDPVKVVIGLIRAHDGLIDADLLKHELVPAYIAQKDWSRWWTKARDKIKRNPHITVEGRSPVILQYDPHGRTIEEETWETFSAQRDPVDWLSTAETYLREKKSLREAPDEGLLGRMCAHVFGYIEEARRFRPAEALACALLLSHLQQQGFPVTDEQAALAAKMVEESEDPAELLQRIENETLRNRGILVLQEVRPDAWGGLAITWLPTAPANLLDTLVGGAIEAGRTEEIQAFIDAGLTDLPNNPELVYWLWKGPKHQKQLNLPADEKLFRMILDVLSTLGRRVSAEAAVVKTFRHRARAALALRSLAKAKKCVSALPEEAAITVRRQLERLEGVGDTLQIKLLDALRDAHPKLWVVKQRRIEPWEDQTTLWCTSQGLNKRTAERDEIVNVEMPANAKRIGEAASHGDLSENSEYKFALEERDLLRGRLAKVNEELSIARTLDVHDIPSDYVGIGTRVRMRSVGDGHERVMTFFGPFETDVDKGIYSYQAPVAQMLMGHRVGDCVPITLEGPEAEFEIIAIENALEHPTTQDETTT